MESACAAVASGDRRRAPMGLIVLGGMVLSHRSRKALLDGMPQEICVSGVDDCGVTDGKDCGLEVCGGSRSAGDCGSDRIPATKHSHLTVTSEVTDPEIDTQPDRDHEVARVVDTASMAAVDAGT